MFTNPVKAIANWISNPHKKRCFALKEGNAADDVLLGRKGANLCELFRLDLNVPAATIISSDFSLEYNHQSLHQQLPDYFISELRNSIHDIEKQTGKVFGSTGRYR